MVRLRGTVPSWSPSSMWMLFAAVFNAVRVGEASGRDTIGDLAQWLEDRDGSVGGLAVADVPGRGRGLLAATKLVPNRRLISVPSQCVLYERHVKDETVEMQRLVSYLQANETAQDMVSNKFLLSAFILEQLQHRSPSKRFAPYLRDLRKSAQTMLPRLPLFWPAEDQAELQGTMAEHELPRMRRAMRREYDVLSAAAPNLAASHPLAEYQAAYSFVAARSFTLPPEAGEDAVLYPFIDMANHEIVEPNATLNSEEFEEHLREAAAARVEVKHQAGGFTAHLFSQRAFLARQEVTVAYGFHPNYYALLRYGFVRLELAVDWLPRGEKSRWKKLLRKVAGNAVSFNVEACAVPGPGLSDALAFARLWSSEQGPASLKRCGLDLNQASWKVHKAKLCLLDGSRLRARYRGPTKSLRRHLPMATASLASRARGAVVGCLVADAAAVPCHWCYDPTKLAEHLKAAKRGPAFCDPPGNVFYTPPPGGFSCYGDQTMALLESLVACEGKLDVEDYCSRLEGKFGKASAYEVEAVDPENWPELKKNPTDADGNVIEAERKWSMPLPGPWRHGSVKGFLKNYVVEKKKSPDCGSNDEQVDGCCKVAPLVALLAGEPALLPCVDTAVRVTQNTDKASAFACGFARVLEKLVLGTPTVSEAISAAQADLANPDRAFKTNLDDEVAANLARVVGEFSGMPHSEEWKLDIACFLHTASAEHKALDLVEGALAMARQRLAGGSLEEEEQLLSDNSLLSNLRMAVTLRRDEKDTIQKLETFLHHARARLRRAGAMWRYYLTEEAVVKSKHAEL
eukprot:s2835_g2.t1